MKNSGFSLTKYVSMEYLKGSYSFSNTQATWLAPPGSLVIVIVIVIVTGKPTLNFFL